MTAVLSSRKRGVGARPRLPVAPSPTKAAAKTLSPCANLLHDLRVASGALVLLGLHASALGCLPPPLPLSLPDEAGYRHQKTKGHMHATQTQTHTFCGSSERSCVCCLCVALLCR